ncbi:aldehyde dehydrogenase family protein [Streptomyces sp. YIM S03343]
MPDWPPEAAARPTSTEASFIEPTVFADVDNRSVIAQEEIFGPVLIVIAEDGEDDAIAEANDTVYGLNASVHTNDVERAYSVARGLHSGTVGHNGPRTDGTITFGGFKQSGIGREGGAEGLRAFLEPKTVLLDATHQQLGSSARPPGDEPVTLAGVGPEPAPVRGQVRHSPVHS